MDGGVLFHRSLVATAIDVGNLTSLDLQIGLLQLRLDVISL